MKEVVLQPTVALRSAWEATVLRLVDVGARWRYRLVRMLCIPLLRALFRIEVRGREFVPASGPYIVAANHLNWPDAPLLLIAFPLVPRMNFIGDATFVRESGFLWFLVRQVGGVLPLVEHSHASLAFIHVVTACLRRHGSIAIFPEGRYADREGSLLPFHRGFAKLALAEHVAVVPVAIGGTKHLWLRKSLIVVIGKPIEPGTQTVDSLTELTRERIAAMRPAQAERYGRRLFSGPLTRLFP